jgi:5-formyltetrahydrofolate cyclo-ligase
VTLFSYHHDAAADAGGAVAVLPSAHEVKQSMRERIRAERLLRSAEQRARDAHDIATVAQELPEIARARCVAAYTSTPSAPGTLPLRRSLRAAGVRVLLPVLLDDGHLDWSVDTTLDPAGPDQRNELLGLEGIGEAEVLVIPALAVDTLGNRLGQGAGFYDRALRMIDPTVTVFAIVHERELLDAAIEPVPAEAHDRRVDAVITPRGFLRMPPHRRP